MLFELLTGEPLYDITGSSTQGQLIAHLHHRPRPLRSLRSDVSVGIEQLIAAMLAKRPERRPTMADVADRLQNAQQALPGVPASLLANPAFESVQARTQTKAPTPKRTPPVSFAAAMVRRLVAIHLPRRWSLALLGAVAAMAVVFWRLAALADDCTRIKPLPGMACVPGGTFLMGSTDAEVDAAFADCQHYYHECKKDWYLREQPTRQITLSPFLMSVHEVTNQEFVEWLRHPSQLLHIREGRFVADAEGDLLDLSADCKGIAYWDERFIVLPGAAEKPVVCVSWHAARAYCRFHGWDLPTEAQWEWAARGATLIRAQYPWGNHPPTCEGVVMARRPGGFCRALPSESARAGTSYQDRSPQRILDLGGNVEEWIRDRFMTPYPDCGRCLDPTAPGEPGGADVYVVRGGSRNEIPPATRAAARTKAVATEIEAARGFRCVAQIKETIGAQR